MKTSYVYIVSNSNHSTLYIGVTNNINRRIFEHKSRVNKGFTNHYRLFHLLYYEVFDAMHKAIKREKQLKRWHKQWKWNLIKESNPQLIDLAAEWDFGEFDGA